MSADKTPMPVPRGLLVLIALLSLAAGVSCFRLVADTEPRWVLAASALAFGTSSVGLALRREIARWGTLVFFALALADLFFEPLVWTFVVLQDQQAAIPRYGEVSLPVAAQWLLRPAPTVFVGCCVYGAFLLAGFVYLQLPAVRAVFRALTSRGARS